MNPSRLPLLLAAAGALGCLGFAAVTGHMWEDYFITFRASLNLATGHGLVFQPGERVHSFTSPLGTLLPALFALGGGDDVATRALWCFRLVSALALGAAIGLAARTSLRSGVAPLAVAAAGLAWGLDAKTVDYAINGMECALLVFFLVLTWQALATGAGVRPLALGVAGLQWTRPDGGVFFAVLGIAWLVFGDQGQHDGVRSRVARLVRGGALGLALYLPWLLWAAWYYGSPVPHTILAKVSHLAPGELARALLLYPWHLLSGDAALLDVFKPAYFYFGGWPPVVGPIAHVMTLSAALAWLWPGLRPSGRIASAAFFLGGFYVEYIPRSPWYYPGWEALAFITWAHLLDFPANSSTRRAALLAATARIAGACLVLIQSGLLLAVAVQMRHQQAVIEDGHRREIGRWLGSQAAAGDRVYLEPLGYIGYFSGLKMLDYPGLASPEVVAARRAGHLAHAGIIRALAPEWLVLRPDQVAGIRSDAPDLLATDYRLARVFDVRPQVDAIGFLPGRGYLAFDAVYLVFQRVAPRPGVR
jgi:hypothetical protein